MEIKLNIPDDILNSLVHEGEDPATQLLEFVAVNAYRNRRLSLGAAARLLRLGYPPDFHQVLKKYDLYLNYSADDLSEDLANLGVISKEKVAA